MIVFNTDLVACQASLEAWLDQEASSLPLASCYSKRNQRLITLDHNKSDYNLHN